MPSFIVLDTINKQTDRQKGKKDRQTHKQAKKTDSHTVRHRQIYG